MLPRIKDPEELMDIVNKMGGEHELLRLEAEIILGYLDGSDYSLLYCHEEHGEQYFVIHDNQDENEDSGTREHSLKGVIEKCDQLCYEILCDARNDDNATKDYIAVLVRDEYILDRLCCDYKE